MCHAKYIIIMKAIRILLTFSGKFRNVPKMATVNNHQFVICDPFMRSMKLLELKKIDLDMSSYTVKKLHCSIK